MIEVELQDKLGERLTRVILPTYNPMPQVLIWRQVIFLRISDHYYRECFSYHILEPELKPYGKD